MILLKNELHFLWLLQVNILFYFKATRMRIRNTEHCIKSTKISPNFLVWKFCEKAQFPQSFGQVALNSAKTVTFHKISTPGN